MVFILPILLIFIVLELLIRQIPNDYSIKKKLLVNHSAKINTLILGSSHSYYGLNPLYFNNNTFNAAFDGQPLEYDYEILKNFENHFQKLNTLVLPISIPTLFIKSAKDIVPNYNYVVFMDLKLTNSVLDNSILINSPLKNNIKNTFRYYFEGNSIANCTNMGWGSNYHSSHKVDLSENGYSRAISHNNVSCLENEVLEENLKTLKLIVNWCNCRKIKVVLFTPPAFISYRENINYEQYKKTVYSTMNIAKIYENCEYYNFFENNEFTAGDFYDSDHLNEIGAKKLSILIKSLM